MQKCHPMDMTKRFSSHGTNNEKNATLSIWKFCEGYPVYVKSRQEAPLKNQNARHCTKQQLKKSDWRSALFSDKKNTLPKTPSFIQQGAEIFIGAEGVLRCRKNAAVDIVLKGGNRLFKLRCQIKILFHKAWSEFFK